MKTNLCNETKNETAMTSIIPSYLLSDCAMGHAGFNNFTNNRDGYSTESAARRASVNLLVGKN